MPPATLWDCSDVNFEQAILDLAEIELVNPHRFEMQQLSGICRMDKERGRVAAVKQVREDDFWVRGHFPGRPLMPGVLMLEAAAQMVSYAIRLMREDEVLVGLSGVEGAKFRGAVVPPCRLDMIGQLVENRSRRFSCDTQGFIDGVMVFEARIIGTPL